MADPQLTTTALWAYVVHDQLACTALGIHPEEPNLFELALCIRLILGSYFGFFYLCGCDSSYVRAHADAVARCVLKRQSTGGELA